MSINISKGCDAFQKKNARQGDLLAEIPKAVDTQRTLCHVNKQNKTINIFVHPFIILPTIGQNNLLNIPKMKYDRYSK